MREIYGTKMFCVRNGAVCVCVSVCVLVRNININSEWYVVLVCACVCVCVLAFMSKTMRAILASTVWFRVVCVCHKRVCVWERKTDAAASLNWPATKAAGFMQTHRADTRFSINNKIGICQSIGDRAA